MASYIKFKGVSTASLADVYINEMPSHKKGSMRHTEYYVKGRDGALNVDEGRSNYEITARLLLLAASVASRYAVNAWADGTGKLILSDDPDKAYIASVKDEVSWERDKIGNKLYDIAEITWTCQPYMVEAVDSTTTLTATGTVVNIGNMVAYPTLVVNGEGNANFYINGNEIQIDGTTANVPVTIDCTNGYVYTSEGAVSIRGDIPYFVVGDNTVTFGENVTSIVITPNWRWM